MQVLGVALVSLGASFIFSMLGAGGSQVLVPALFWLGMDFKTGAIPLALLESAVTCFSAGAVYLRRGLVVKKTAVPVALAVLAGAPVGALVNFGTSSTLLMLIFAASNILIAFVVLSGKTIAPEGLSRRAELVTGIAIGLGIGFIIGLIGRDGGPFVLAALVLIGYSAKEAAGSTSLIVAAGCLVAFLTHLPHATFGWWPALAGCIACLAGSQIGSRLMTERLDSRAVRILFGAVMLVIGVVILVQAL